MNRIEQPATPAIDAASHARSYAERLSRLLAGLDVDAIGRLADLLQSTRATGKTVFLAGNGGSAAAASHWATDLTHGASSAGARPIRAISLVDNAASITAIANDRAYEHIFVAQLEKLLQPGDLVIVISASGNSPNVVRAVEFANDRGGVTVGILGFDGGRLKDLCRHVVMVPTAAGEYGPVEDIHMVIDHILTTWLKAQVG
jgi:D-sedoheptulose 7-phosphate isomerase